MTRRVTSRACRGLLAGALAAGLIAAGAAGGASAQDNSGLGDLPINPQWLVNTLANATNLGSVKNNVIDGAITRRDEAVAQWKAAQAAFKAGNGPQPNPLAKPTYNVVWSSKQNVADIHADVISKFIQAATVNPQGLADLLNPQFLPGLDGFQVIDLRPKNLDGSDNPDYGKVVNFVQLPLPWGLENEAHHMQYEWEDGDPILAGGLYTGTTHVLDPSDIPNLKLLNQIPITETPGGSIADAYEKGLNGRYYLTLMGGPLANFGGSPGEIVTFKPHPTKGVVVESESPAGTALAGGLKLGRNPNGVPEPCSLREARPLGTCANPHGIQFRTDLGVGVTADYAEPREIVLDPVKVIDKYAFRPTVRSWDISGPNARKPKLIGVGHVPNGPLRPAQRAHEQYGIMEDAKTWPDAKKKYNGIDSKGLFAGSMCGGGIFFIPDITKAKGDFSDQIVQVWNDGLSIAQTPEGKDADEPGGCAGGAWHQVAPNNKILFRSVQGRNPGSDNYFDKGQAKLVYTIDISPLIESAQDGEVDCDLSRGIRKNGLNLSGIQLFNKLVQGEKIADCPTLISALPVKDITSGGPHWGALDNHTVDQNGVPWRLTFSNYFVSRTGVDGDHRFYNVNVAPDGKLSYDESFRDENTGAIGVNFNRRDWPGNPDAGFYKPHSEIWVCPPGICPKGAEPAVRAAPAAATSCRSSVTVRLDRIKGRKVTGGNFTFAGRTVRAKRNKKTGRWTAVLNLRNVKATKFKVTKRIRTSAGRTVTRTSTVARCPTIKPASTKKASTKKASTKKASTKKTSTTKKK
ncbi:MAG: hypothetical protein Q8O56_00590 [Solirubrobacteraceae bacterium]|nr:hypothetical protein [Solirubrobacteraceae bacterium]